MDNIPELLAPAGDTECAFAAFESGADAIYAGLPKFSARDKSNNFTLTEMSKISAYAKTHDKKLYLALNTLVKETELEEIYKYLASVSEIGIDAIIVQDPGIAWMIRTLFPNMTIHGSTQMGIHNSAGIETAAAIGLSRVILERQVTLTELEVIVKKSSLEVEVFAHGALCSSLSGNCLFSSSIGGWSGNRGKCKQPCRRRYHSKDGKNGFFFSPDDLYTLDILPQLIETGIVSIKIEGRLKKADYVRRAVTAYRMVLDNGVKVLGKAKMILAGSPGRKWSSGFYTNVSMENLINYRSPGISGMLCGEVTESSPRGITVKVSREIKKGDRIRIQPKSGDEGPQMTVTAMYRNKARTNKAIKDDKVFISFNQPVQTGSLVYKTGDLAEKPSININSLPEYSNPLVVDLEITVNSNGLNISLPQYPDIELWKYSIEIEEASKYGLTEDIIKESFRSTKDKQLKTGYIDTKIKGNLFLPASILKKIRRKFWEDSGTKILSIPTEQKTSIFDFMRIHSSSMGYNEENESEKNVVITNPEKVKTEKTRKINSKLSEAFSAMPLYSYTAGCKEVTLPYFTDENKLEELKQKIDKAYKDGIRRFRVCSLFNLSLLKGYSDILVTAAYPLPVSNSFTARQLKELGVNVVQSWIELEKEAIINFVYFSPLPVEIYRYGRPHIFTTRALLSVDGEITDSHGVKFFVKRDPETGLQSIFGHRVIKLPEIDNTSSCFDYRNAEPGETASTDFNFSREWV